MALKLGEILMKAGMINEDMLAHAQEEQKKNGSRIGSCLVKLGYITEEQLLNALSKQFNVPSINLSGTEINENTLKLIPAELAGKYLAIPVSRFGRILTLAMADPSDLAAIEDIKFATRFEIKPVVASEHSILKLIEKYYHIQKMLSDVMHDLETIDDTAPDMKSMIGEIEEVTEKKEEEDLSDAITAEDSGPAVKLVSKIITDAVTLNVSDVHVEPYEKDLRVRYRIDGILHEVMKPPLKVKKALATVIKVMSKLKIEEKRLPQDGRIKAKVKGRIVDIRVSTVPTLFGEKIALRLLDRSAITLSLDVLGFEELTLTCLRRAIKTPYGIVLVTGPTGCGKTTTLYSALTELNDPGLNIITAEDPIEYSLHGINQLQVNEKIGLTFASALRSYLRQDPNIIMVGEIRDFETAEIAIRASLTGHLVLSTVHTNSAAATVTRLVNMNVEPFLIASTLLCIESQRLVRKICENCREQTKVPESMLIDAGLDPKHIDFPIYKGRGCDRCRGTGYRGRVGLFEVMLITSQVREAILKRIPTHELEKIAVEEGMLTLRVSGLDKLKQGITTVDEVIRETKVE